MPRVNHQVEVELSTWVKGLDTEALYKSLSRFGIDPRACVKRLDALKAAMGFTAADSAINQLWVV